MTKGVWFGDEKLDRINFGCGPVYAKGWYNLDSDQTQMLDVTSLEDFPDDSVDYIVAHHSLQCIDFANAQNVSQNFFRVLKKLGTVRISVPNIIAGFNAYQNNDISFFPAMNNEEIEERFTHWLTWYSTNVSPYTVLSLYHLLKDAGFETIKFDIQQGKTFSQYPEIMDLDTRWNESIYVEAIK